MRILFVCTGNTCRSPLAEVLCAKLRPEWEARSRGISACEGAPASKLSFDAAAEYGCDLSAHLAHMVTEEDMEWAEAAYGITRGHTSMLRASFPAFADKVKELPGGDIPDPIGGTLEDYLGCAARLEGDIEQI